MDLGLLQRHSDFEWEIPRHGAMRVPAVIHADEQPVREMDHNVYEKALNVAMLPGIVRASWGLPEDLERIEENGRTNSAKPEKVSKRKPVAELPVLNLATRVAGVLSSVLLVSGVWAGMVDSAEVARRFEREVTLRLEVPASEQRGYAERLREALAEASVQDAVSQYVLLVDRAPAVQATFVYFVDPGGDPRFVGATRASTGKAGGYDYFFTPLGVFRHTPDNMDYRAEGTRNALGIRGYGIKGMRVYDFGWVQADRSWDPPARSSMRLQLHATDPILEKYLGRVRSKGCIRVPASLNTFIDRYGLLDSDYEARASAGGHLWVLRPDRQPVPGAGRYLVIVDSGRKARPVWSP